MIKLHYTLPAPADFDSYAIRVYELNSPQEEGTLIDTIIINPLVSYIETENAVSEFSWFKLEVVNQDESATLLSEDPILGEVAHGRVVKLREAIKDTKRGDPAFSDQELVEKLRFSAMRLNNIKNLSTIEEKYWPIIELLARIDICSILAFDYAKYIKLEIPGGPTLAKDELYTHYMRVMEQLQKYYDNIKDDISAELEEAGDGDKGSTIHVSTMSRLSFETGAVEEDIDGYLYGPSTLSLYGGYSITDLRKNLRKLY
jgi:hypothetical protein